MSDQNGSGAANQNVGDVTDAKSSGDVVKYETYNRVLSEAKKLKEKVKEYEAASQNLQEQKLREQNEYKQLADTYKQQLEGIKSKFEDQEKSIINGLKYQEFEKHLGGKLRDRDYATFVDFEKIVLDPETRKVNEDSAKAVAAEFIKRHASLVEFGSTAKLPNQAASSASVSGGKDVSKMTPKELEEYIVEMNKLGKLK